MNPGIVGALLLASSAALLGQQPAPQPGFDVVSIKPSQPGAQNRLPRINPGRVEIVSTTLKGLIRMAYSRFPFDTREIAAGPSWIDSERFDLIATMNLPPPWTRAGCRPGSSRCFARIEDRFGVRTHNERRGTIDVLGDRSGRAPDAELIGRRA